MKSLFSGLGRSSLLHRSQPMSPMDKGAYIFLRPLWTSSTPTPATTLLTITTPTPTPTTTAWRVGKGPFFSSPLLWRHHAADWGSQSRQRIIIDWYQTWDSFMETYYATETYVLGGKDRERA